MKENSAPDDCPHLGDLARGRVSVEPRQKRAAECRGNARCGRFRGNLVAVAEVDDGVGLQHRLGELFDEQGDAVGSLGDGIDEILGKVLVVRQMPDDGFAGRSLQAIEGQTRAWKERTHPRLGFGPQGQDQ